MEDPPIPPGGECVVCARRRPAAAVTAGDPFCSRRCVEVHFGLTQPTSSQAATTRRQARERDELEQGPPKPARRSQKVVKPTRPKARRLPAAPVWLGRRTGRGRPERVTA